MGSPHFESLHRSAERYSPNVGRLVSSQIGGSGAALFPEVGSSKDSIGAYRLLRVRRFSFLDLEIVPPSEPTMSSDKLLKLLKLGAGEWRLSGELSVRSIGLVGLLPAWQDKSPR